MFSGSDAGIVFFVLVNCNYEQTLSFIISVMYDANWYAGEFRHSCGGRIYIGRYVCKLQHVGCVVQGSCYISN
jgi:hypothetical protein